MNARTEAITKEAVTVAEMARMMGLSRARFYQLQRAGVVPPPCFSIVTRRPLYTAEGQQICLEVRRRNCGIDGRPILFYARRPPTAAAPAVRRRRAGVAATTATGTSAHAELRESLHALGLNATAAQVAQAVDAEFPAGTAGLDEGTVVRQVYQSLRRQNPGGNVGR